jgi:nicotinamidase/pyrazinamidase
MRTLVLVDIQNDFLPGGTLPVPEGDATVPSVNRLLPRFDLAVATQYWHPAEHGSFAANHPGRKPFEQVELEGLPQTLWPVHCVQNTGGACFAPGLDTRRIQQVFPKGTDPRVDSYSGFFDNGHRRATGLAAWLRARGAQELWLAGLATDYCVKFTALDAVAEGFRVYLIEDACRGVNLRPGDVARAIEDMRKAGVTITTSRGVRDD